VIDNVAAGIDKAAENFESAMAQALRRPGNSSLETAAPPIQSFFSMTATFSPARAR